MRTPAPYQRLLALLTLLAFAAFGWGGSFTLDNGHPTGGTAKQVVPGPPSAYSGSGGS